MTKIVVPISDEERILLVQMALQNSCHPREQARIIIRDALLSRHNTENKQALPVGFPRPVTESATLTTN